MVTAPVLSNPAGNGALITSSNSPRKMHGTVRFFRRADGYFPLYTKSAPAFFRAISGKITEQPARGGT